MTSGTPIHSEPREQPGVGVRRWKNPLSPKTTLGRRRIVGTLLFLALFGLFLSQNRFPKLDIVRKDVAIATQGITNCFQGFCFDPDRGLWEKAWDFSLAYIDLVTIGMIFAFLVAGLVDVFLFPTSSGPVFGKRGWRGSLQGLTVGPLMTLCSACIVPVANSFKKQGARVEATIAITQGSATLNVPALFMIFVVFSPLLAVSRVAFSVVGALVLGPLVAWLVNRRREDEVLSLVDDRLGIVEETGPPDSWLRVVSEGSKEWLVSAWRFFYRLAPIMVVAGFIGGLAIQFLTEEGVSTLLGNHLLGVAVAATFGVLINVPLLFEIPLVAGLMLMGMGIAPGATLLFAAAAAGPITFWGLSRQIGRKAVAWYAATTWVLAIVGGIVVVGINAAFPAEADTSVIGFEPVAPADAVESSPVFVEEAVAVVPSTLESAAQTFVDVTSVAGVDAYHWVHGGSAVEMGCAELMAGGAAVADYDEDGWLDLFVARIGAPDVLYRNLGDGTFADVAIEAGLDFAGSSNGAAWADVDGDADLDLLVTTLRHEPTRLYINDGSGRFRDEAEQRGVSMVFAESDECNSTFGGTFADYDRDGDLDLHLSQWYGRGPGVYRTRLLRNAGDGTFVDVTVETGVAMPDVSAFGSSFVDLDGDGWQELIVTADHGGSRVFRNTGAGTFEDVTAGSGMTTEENGMGSAFGDIDGDGDLDAFITSIYDGSGKCDVWGCSGNRLFRNDGDLFFSDVTDVYGVRDGGWGWGTAMFDYDNDGDQDIGMAAGFEVPSDDERLFGMRKLSERFVNDPLRMWRNDGEGILLEVAKDVGLVYFGSTRSMIPFDYDNDGDLDIFVTASGREPALFRNDLHDSSYLGVRLIGADGNTAAIGARIEMRTTAGATPQVRVIGASPGYLGQAAALAHVGLGDHDDLIAELTIWWPGSGELTRLKNVQPSQVIVIEE